MKEITKEWIQKAEEDAREAVPVMKKVRSFIRKFLQECTK
jgi:HEPN domain-containing protein